MGIRHCLNKGKGSVPFVFLLVPLSLPAFVSAENRSEYWFQTPLSYSFNPEWRLAFKQRLRFEDSGELFAEERTLGIVRKDVADRLDISAALWQGHTRREGDWLRETRPRADVTLPLATEQLSLKSRSRIEFRYREDNNNQRWRYRQKFTLRPTRRLWEDRISPYLSDEVFLNLQGSQRLRNRLTVGSDLAITENLALDVFYIWQRSERKSDWLSIHVLGLGVNISF